MEVVLKEDLALVIDAIQQLKSDVAGLVIQTKYAPVFTNDLLAKLLGVSKRTLQSWRDSGKINFSKIDRTILYRRQDVEKLLADYSNELFDEGTGRKSKKQKRF